MFSEKLLDDKGVEIGQANEFGEQISTYERVSDSENIKISKDNDGVQTAYGYNRTGECIEMSTTIDDTANVTTYGYEKDFLTSLKHNDFEITYDYDEQGRNNKISIAGEEYLEKTFGQDEETTRLASGESFRAVFDADGNVAEQYLNDSLAVQYSYDGYGNVLSTKEFFTDKSGKSHTAQHNYSYDKFGNTIYEEMSQHSDTDKWNFDIDTKFDEGGNVASRTFVINGKPQEYEYAYSDDPDAKLEAVSLPNGAVQTIDYDKLSRVHKVELNVADTTLEHREYEYLKVGDHASNLVGKLKFARDGVQKEMLRYKYDEKGNITEIRENNSLLARYKYDGLSRLVREDNKQFAKTTTFEYDAGGNILRRVEYAFTLAENLEEVDGKVFEYNYSLTGWRDQLKEYNGQAFEYDAIGNPTTYRDQTLTWSHGRRLDKFGDIAEYTYNANGIRTSKIFDNFTTKYFLNGNKILIQEDASNTLTFFYGADGVTGFHIKNSVIDADYYYKKNLQNDIIGIYDNQGTLIAKYEYDAWGNQKIKILQNFVKYVDLEEDFQYNDISDVDKFVAFKNPFRYRSYYYDFETNLYYLNSRYYDPELARFVNADDISNLDKESFNGLNLYAYCNNAPTINFDPNGDSLIALLFILLATTIAGAVANGVKAYNNGARGWDLFGEIVLGAAFGLAAGGAIISTIAVFAGALGFATVFGVGVAQAFAIGTLAFNFTAFVIAPLFGIDMEGIEFEATADSPSYKPPEYSYPTNALTLIKHNNLFNKRTIGNDLLFWKNIQYFKKIFGKN